MTTIASTTAPIKDLTFPKVYVCNLNQALTKSGMVTLGINTTNPEQVLVMNVWGMSGGNVAKNEEGMAAFKVLQQKVNQFAPSGVEDMLVLIQCYSRRTKR